MIHVYTAFIQNNEHRGECMSEILYCILHTTAVFEYTKNCIYKKRLSRGKKKKTTIILGTLWVNSSTTMMYTKNCMYIFYLVYAPSAAFSMTPLMVFTSRWARILRSASHDASNTAGTPRPNGSGAPRPATMDR